MSLQIKERKENRYKEEEKTDKKEKKTDKKEKKTDKKECRIRNLIERLFSAVYRSRLLNRIKKETFRVKD